MKYLASLLLILGFGLSAFGQTIKSLGYNTTNGQVVANTTNALTFTNETRFGGGDIVINVNSAFWSGNGVGINFEDGAFISGDTNAQWRFDMPFYFISSSFEAQTRTNLGLGWSALTNTNAATSLLGFTTNGQVVANTGTNKLNFTNHVAFGVDGIETYQAGFRGYGVSLNLEEKVIEDAGLVDPAVIGWSGGNYIDLGLPLFFPNTTNAATTRANLGFSTNLNTLWTATNASNARSAVGLGATNSVTFQRITVDPSASAAAFRFGTNLTGLWSGADDNYGSFFVRAGGSSLVSFETNRILFFTNVVFDGGSSGVVAAQSRTNLGLGWSALTNTNASNFRDAIGLGATNTVTFSNVVNNGNFTNNNGTIYGLKTNVGPFEGIGNFFASNNTTVGNETLFRVGVAEATNKSAQFGFRVARTNNGGEGLAVFSVFGYNALMMIGPSDRSRSNSLTNTNAAIEADIWTMSETNRVMTLRDTNTGAMVMHRPIGFNTNDSNVLTTAPANTNVTNPTGWIQIYVGTNSVRVPYYQ